MPNELYLMIQNESMFNIPQFTKRIFNIHSIAYYT